MPFDPLVMINYCFEKCTNYIEKYSICSGLDISVSSTVVSIAALLL